MKENYHIKIGDKFGNLTVVSALKNYKWKCKCNCGNYSTPTGSNLISGHTKSCGGCGKNNYRYSEDGLKVIITTTNGVDFIIDKEDEELVRKYKWYATISKSGIQTIISSDRVILHRLLFDFPKNVEIDHIDLNRLNNSRSNLRICTHQQNQVNQPLQKNNNSGVSGVSWYSARNKYRARIKIGQKDIHLGYYEKFIEAVQARNVGMECMFGEYGIYNDVAPAPKWIRDKVIEKCRRFADLSLCRAFFISDAVSI